MANQIIIDIGAAANDGTGDPLRTAFNYVNENFTSIWDTGVANSNVLFSGNRILTVNTNGNLVLSPNGTGKVQSNVDVIPNANNTHSLGSGSLRWNTVYAQNLDVGGNVEFNNLTVDGNLTVTGNTIQIGNITTETKTIQLANAASTANAANGSGVTVGANDDIATMLYNSTSNTWVMNIGANITGNVTAPYFIGNGSLLTGIASYANANAVAYGQAGWAGNIIPSGNAVYSLGNATNQWNDLYVSNATIFMNNVPLSLTAGNVLTVNGEAVLTNDSTTSISTTGNITADYFFGDGSQLTGLSTSSISNGTSNVDIPVANGNVIINTSSTYAWTFDNTGNLTIPGTISSSSTIGIDNRASGNTADIQLFAADDILLQARDRTAGSGSEGGDINIYAGDSAEDSDSSGGDIQILAGDGGAGNVDFASTGGFITIRSGQGGAAIGNSGASAAGGGSLTLQAGSAGDNNGNIDLGANGGDVVITAGLSTGNLNPGGDVQITSGQGGANASAGQIELNVPISDAGPGGTWSFNYTGDLNLPTNGNINFNGGSIAQALNEDFYIRASDDEADGWSIYNVIDDGAGNILSQTRLEFDQYTIRTDAQGASYTWAFRDTGVLELPGDIYGNVGGNLTVKIGDSAGSDTFIDLQTRSYVGDALISNIRIANPNVTVSTANAAYNWTFGSTGTLTFPSLANISGGNFNAGTASASVALNAFSPDGNTVSIQAQGNTSSAVISIFSNAGPVTSNWTFTTAPLDPSESFLYVPNGGAISTPDATGGEGGKNIFIQAGASDPVTWNSNPGGELFIKGGYGSFGDGGGGPGGNVNIEGGASSDSHAGNVNITCGPNSWVFDYSGNVTIPGNINAVLSSPAPSLNGFNSVNAVNVNASGNISGNTAGFAIGYRDIPQVSFTGNATIATTDAGKHFYSTQSSNFTLTIANNASQGFQVGAAITVVNQGTGTISIAQGSGVTLYLAGNATAGNRSVSTFGMATIMKVATDTWFINGTGVS